MSDGQSLSTKNLSQSSFAGPLNYQPTTDVSVPFYTCLGLVDQPMLAFLLLIYKSTNEVFLYF